MKKIIYLLFFVLCFVISPVSGQGSGRKLTVMVYMCGSNLESEHNYASEDIREMQNAGIDQKEVSVLVMTGGSASWGLGYDISQIYIHEISARGSRVLWKSDAMNMGSRSTLTQLLKYAKENRPAEQYALILWDHGGGPLEGVCWDEVFSPDRLDLKEIVEGIEKADLGQKLSWIGFDACLMSSMETAAALSPYAEYMIASQETEPPAGWNYSFLKGIENDANGAATGRRIVDAFFEGQDDQEDVLTLACTDLAKASEAVSAFEDFFAPIGFSVDEESFARLSGIRLASTGFGKSVRGFGDTGYDLVDAADLVSRLNIDGTGTKLLGLIRDSVVYSRSNEEGANGLSLYHPYVNKERYLAGWRDEYSRLGFDQGYTQYIKNFGTILTGAELVDWSGLDAVFDGLDETGVNHLSMQLTPEQAANVSSVQLLILSNGNEYSTYYDNELMDYDPAKISWMLVSSDKAKLDENGVVHGDYDGSMLYIQKEDGEKIGPLSFIQTDDGKFNVMQLIYRSVRDEGQNEVVQYYLPADNEDRNPEAVRLRIWDKVTESYTNRVGFQEEKFDTMVVVNFTHKYPMRNNNGALPGFEDWELNSNTTSWNPLRFNDYVVNKTLSFSDEITKVKNQENSVAETEDDTSDLSVEIDTDQFFWEAVTLPDSWSFYMSDRQTDGKQLFAMFQITDLQQNVYCSVPIPIRNPNLDDLLVTSGLYETRDLRFELSGYVNTSPEAPSLERILRITNLSDSITRIAFDSILINDEYYVMENRDKNIGPRKSLTLGFTYVSDDFPYLDHIRSFSIPVRIYPNADDEDHYEEADVRFELEECDISSIAHFQPPLAETEQEDITIKLFSLEPSRNGGFSGKLFISNRSDRVYSLAASDILLNGVKTQSFISDPSSIPAGMKGTIEFDFDNALAIDGTFFPVSSSDFGEVMLTRTVLSEHALQRQGFDSISDMDIIFRDENNSIMDDIHLQLNEPWPLPDEAPYYASMPYLGLVYPKVREEGSENQCSLLAENDQYSICLERMVFGNNSIALTLEIRNKTDETLLLAAENAALNGEPGDVWFDYVQYAARILFSWLGRPVDAVVETAAQSVDLVSLCISPETPVPDDGITELSVSFRSREQEPTDNVVIRLPEPAFTGMDEGLWYEAEDLNVLSVRTPDVEKDKGKELPLFETAVSLPVNAGSYVYFVEANLSDEEKAEFEKGTAALIYLPFGNDGDKLSDDAIIRLTHKSFGISEDGRYGTEMPFLSLGLENEEKDQDRNAIGLAIISSTEDGFVFQNDFSNKFLPLQNPDIEIPIGFEIKWDPETDLAEVQNFTVEDDILSDRVHADYWCVHHTLFVKTENPDKTVHYNNVSQGKSVQDICIPLYGKPVRFGLYPLERLGDLERFYILITIFSKDGKVYSLPFIPVSDYFFFL